MLLNQTSLEKLDLSSNAISDDGGIEIAKSLEVNSTLLSLNLRNNEMKGRVAEVFMNCLRKNKVILDIDVTMNDFESRTQMQLQKSIKEHKASVSEKISDFAEKKIELLKEKEKELFATREAILNTLNLVQNAKAEKQKRIELLESLKIAKENEEKALDEKIENRKKLYEEKSEIRRHQLADVNAQKAQADKEETEAVTEINSLTSKSSFVSSRVERAEAKLLEVQVNGSTEISVLKSTLDSLKDQLKAALILAQETKAKILKKEEEERIAREAEERLQQEKENELKQAEENLNLKQKTPKNNKRGKKQKSKDTPSKTKDTPQQSEGKKDQKDPKSQGNTEEKKEEKSPTKSPAKVQKIPRTAEKIPGRESKTEKSPTKSPSKAQNSPEKNLGSNTTKQSDQSKQPETKENHEESINVTNEPVSEQPNTESIDQILSQGKPSVVQPSLNL